MLTGIRACVFDAYGTLFDFASAASGCTASLGDKAGALTALWRDKQLQYSWLRGLQRRYVPFWQVTGDALDHALDALDLAGQPGLRDRLMDLYRTLGAFPEVPATLAALRQGGFRAAVLSNGSPDMLASAVSAAGLDADFEAVLSVDAVQSFKPDPLVYQLALDRLGLPEQAVAFISSNAWDAHAAAAFGMQAVWCNRQGQPPERLPGTPARMIHSLDELPGLLRG
ncbi:haloacid dehalogenase type II [Falsiroseomonas tokyonensis]|uniref:Haloacid dehalogenase type II n=1 Tax=Falsiroseomonas tokyonensis TaxID=430521 RepID=A0ABV7BZF7_9PROT|nr:haloacid dehalogenase type II [Falsiroseomonas tokyonensis]MBU8539429.1 haloacid dehalogenase type II [Falsiroseomonas tokyonensis]